MGICMGNGKVRSKWDSSGHIYDHNIKDIPLTYGYRIRFYRRHSTRGTNEK
jgi:hypothetical protein